MTENMLPDDAGTHDPAINAAAALREKLIDVMTPGFIAEFDPLEAEQIGAFLEDAMSEADAWASTIDYSETTVGIVHVAQNGVGVRMTDAVAEGNVRG
jgi:hypothetical protein